MRGASKASPYRSSLNASQISAGIQAVKANAKRLMEDARLLFENRRYPTACSLSVLVIEELGKLAVLRRMALAEKQEQWRRCWCDFTDHLSKGSHWIIPYIVNRAETFEDFALTFMDDRNPVILNSLKQLGLYLGCYGKAHWGKPDRVINKQTASVVMHAAERLLLGSQPSSLDSPAAIDLWGKQVGGCFSCPPVIANNVVVEFLQEARNHGIQLEGNGIPPKVAFEFMSTVMYISAEYPDNSNR